MSPSENADRSKKRVQDAAIEGFNTDQSSQPANMKNIAQLLFSKSVQWLYSVLQCTQWRENTCACQNNGWFWPWPHYHQQDNDILRARKINPFGFPNIWILLAYFAPSSSCQSQVPDSILKPHLARYLNIWISDIHIHEYQISKYMNIRYPDIWIWDIRIYEYQISGYMNIKYLDIWISKYLDIWTILAFCCSVFKPSVSQGWPPQAVCCSIYAPWRHQPLLRCKCSNVQFQIFKWSNVTNVQYQMFNISAPHICTMEAPATP